MFRKLQHHRRWAAFWIAKLVNPEESDDVWVSKLPMGYHFAYDELVRKSAISELL